MTLGALMPNERDRLLYLPPRVRSSSRAIPRESPRLDSAFEMHLFRREDKIIKIDKFFTIWL